MITFINSSFHSFPLLTYTPNKILANKKNTTTGYVRKDYAGVDTEEGIGGGGTGQGEQDKRIREGER